MASKHRRCPSVKGGPFQQGVINSPAYWLWQVAFRWGTLGDNSTGSEHKIDGKA
jgi:hypothetical protein